MNRRGFITGLVSLVAAPAIVRYASIMPVRSILPLPPLPGPEVPYWIVHPEIMEALQAGRNQIDHVTGLNGAVFYRGVPVKVVDEIVGYQKFNTKGILTLTRLIGETQELEE